MHDEDLVSLCMKGNSGAGQIGLIYMLVEWRLTLDDAIKGRHGSGREIYRDEQS